MSEPRSVKDRDCILAIEACLYRIKGGEGLVDGAYKVFEATTRYLDGQGVDSKPWTAFGPGGQINEGATAAPEALQAGTSLFISRECQKAVAEHLVTWCVQGGSGRCAAEQISATLDRYLSGKPLTAKPWWVFAIGTGRGSAAMKELEKKWIRIADQEASFYQEDGVDVVCTKLTFGTLQSIYDRCN